MQSDVLKKTEQRRLARIGQHIALLHLHEDNQEERFIAILLLETANELVSISIRHSENRIGL